MDDTTRVADEILSAMERVWHQPVHRVNMCRKFARERNIMTREEASYAYPMGISQAMAAKGWTAERFVRALY